MRFLLSLFLFSIYCITLAQNQQVSVKGKVYDIRSNDALAHVQLNYGNTYSTTTDSNGYFEFNCDTDTLEIRIYFFGYLNLKQIFYLKNNAVNELNIALEPYFNELDEVVVSADKSEKRISELTISMSIIKPIEITKNHIVNAEELINRTQGIEVMDGQASIRGGSGFSYGAGSRVLALIDGLPAISADAGNIRWQFLPIENLSQIEVIKGASSVLYGSSALNGVINFRTDDADTVPQIKYSLMSGIYDQPSQKKWTWWDSPRMYSDASFSFSKRFNNTEIGIGSNVLLDNGYRKLNDEKLARINLKIKHHSARRPGLNYGAGFNSGYNVKRDFILWENADSGALKQNELTATELHGIFLTFDPFLSFISGKKTKQDLRMRLQISDNTFPDNKMNDSYALSNFSEYQVNHQFIKKLNLITGLSHTYSRITSDFYGNHNGNNLAAYAQLEYDLLIKLKLSAGMRFEYNELDAVSDKIVPIFRSGINYQLAKVTFIRASFGQGYRYPSIAEKYAYTTLGAVKIFPNPEVLPEKGWSSEIGLKQGLMLGKIYGHADLSIFYSENLEMIEYVFGIYPDPVTQEFGFGFSSSNIENSRVYGAEIESIMNRNFGRLNLSLGFGYTYIYPVEIDKNNSQDDPVYLKYRRKHAAKFSLNVSKKKFEAGVNAFIKSKILNIDDVFLNPLTRESLLPGFYDYWQSNNTGSLVCDGYLSFRFNNHLKISFAVKNIGNTEYMGRPGDIMPQRFYSLQISGRF